MCEQERTVELSGGSPWGFSIQGGADFRAPLKVTKVSPGGKADLAGVQMNDVIKEICGRTSSSLRHSEALFLIRTAGQSLPLTLQKGGSSLAPYLPPKQLTRSSTAPAPLSPRKKKISSPDKSPIVIPAISPVPVDTEGVGGHDWYKAMHRSGPSSGDERTLLSSSEEEKRPKPRPQPIKAKPRSVSLMGRANGTVTSTPDPHKTPAPPSQMAAVKTEPISPAGDPLLPQEPTGPRAEPLLPEEPTGPIAEPLLPQEPTGPRAEPLLPQEPTGPRAEPLLPQLPVGFKEESPIPQEPVSPIAEPPVPQETAKEPATKKRSSKKKRELKPPPAESATGLYDFTAETKHELSFQRGDTLQLLRTVDQNWLEAQLGAKKGIVPVSYVELTPQTATGPRAVAKFDFVAEESYELGFRKGDTVRLLARVDDNWLQGRLGDATGIFPAEFVNVSVPIEESPPSPRNLAPVENEIRTPVPAEGEGEGSLYRALYAYSPQNADELGLEAGAEVHVIRRCEDGWFMGYHGVTGAFGTFPGNYVQLI